MVKQAFGAAFGKLLDKTNVIVDGKTELFHTLTAFRGGLFFLVFFFDFDQLDPRNEIQNEGGDKKRYCADR